MNKNKVLNNYNAFDIVALLTVLINMDNLYTIQYDKDYSQIVITRQIDKIKDK